MDAKTQELIAAMKEAQGEAEEQFAATQDRETCFRSFCLKEALSLATAALSTEKCGWDFETAAYELGYFWIGRKDIRG